MKAQARAQGCTPERCFLLHALTVVVEHRACLHIGPKLRLALGVQGLVVICLALVKGVTSQHCNSKEERKQKKTVVRTHKHCTTREIHNFKKHTQNPRK